MSALGNLSGRRTAAEFARLLDSGTSAVSTPGLGLVAQLRVAGAALDTAVGPRPEFRDGLRQRLMAVATVQAAQAAQAAVPVAAPRVLAPPVVTPRAVAPRAVAPRAVAPRAVAPRFGAPRALPAAVSWRHRGSAVAAGAMASAIAVSGVAVAGSQSLPGDPFYGVKRTTEALQLRMADGDVEKGTRHLDFAATRLREVRGLTLGRDAVDAGPVLGPSAMSKGLTLRSAQQPLAGGAALSAGVADRVRSTLAEMDEQTREGTELLTGAYRSSRADAPLRALSRFATRQSAGLEQLLPALPPATQPRARASLALLTDVSASTDELIRIGTCGAACDPSSSAPVLPAQPGAPAPATSEPADCACPQPAPTPNPKTTARPEPTAPAGAGQEPTGSPSPQPTPASPSPTPSPSSNPLPIPLPVPVPTLPLPLPSISPSPLLDPVLELLPTLSANSSSGSSPVPAAAPTPVPQLAPLPPRP